jgi:Ca2+-binding RTX toxin-like protein
VNQLSSLNSSVTGSSTNVTSELIEAGIDSFVQFSATTPNFIKAHSYLACQAAIPGLANQPQPLVVTLGVSGSASNGVDGYESASSVPFLVTTTSGALMYSVVIGMILGSFIGARTALDYRRKLLRFSKLETKDPLSPK